MKKKIISSVLGVLHTTRLSTSLVISIIILLPTIGKTNYILLALNLLFTSMGGFALNDYYDFEKDIINKPHRPIPSQRITRNMALTISIIFLFLSFTFSIYNTLSINFGFMQLIFLISMILYNYVTKSIAITKAIYTAFISALVVMYPIFINDFNFMYTLLPVATFFFILGREIFMDILDLKGDEKSGIVTIPILIGKRKSAIAAFFCLLIGMLLVLPLLSININYYDLIRITIVCLSVILFTFLWMRGSLKQKKIAIIFLWVPMLTALTTLLS